MGGRKRIAFDVISFHQKEHLQFAWIVMGRMELETRRILAAVAIRYKVNLANLRAVIIKRMSLWRQRIRVA